MTQQSTFMGRSRVFTGAPTAREVARTGRVITVVTWLLTGAVVLVSMSTAPASYTADVNSTPTSVPSGTSPGCAIITPPPALGVMSQYPGPGSAA